MLDEYSTNTSEEHRIHTKSDGESKLEASTSVR
jgi:hypothetical protein